MRSFEAVLADLETALGPPIAVFAEPEPPGVAGAWWEVDDLGDLRLDAARDGLCVSFEGPTVGNRLWWLAGTPDAGHALTPLADVLDEVRALAA